MRFKSMLKIYRYENQAELLASIEEKVITPAEAMANELRGDMVP